jgi:tetratricopeptide (TPR) repeat protein
MEWCDRLWSTPFAHPDPVHNKPCPEEFCDPDPYLSELRRQVDRRPNEAELHLQLSHAYRDRQMLAAAKPHLERAVALEPGNAFYHAHLGAWHYGQDHFSDGIACYTRAVLLNPGLAVAHWCLAECYEGDGQLELARVHFQKAAELAPKDKTCRAKFARFLRRHPGL